jgi:Family of unknown function (DUF5941)
MTTPAAASTLALYRDDGPLARALARAARPRLRFASDLLLLLGAVPLVAVLAIAGEDAPEGALGLALACLLLLGGLSGARSGSGRFAWVSPPLLRLIEFGGLIAFAVLAGDDAVPAAFALLAAVAYRHYDSVYRIRHQGAAPAPWVRDVGGGWDGRLLLAYVLLVTGAATAGLYVAAALLAALSVAESVASWVGFSRAERPAMYADEEDEDD